MPDSYAQLKSLPPAIADASRHLPARLLGARLLALLATVTALLSACNTIFGFEDPVLKTSSCQEGQTNCAGTCVDTNADPANCGGCAIVCETGQVCSMGSCALSCAGGTTDCSGSCVNTQNEPDH